MNDEEFQNMMATFQKAMTEIEGIAEMLTEVLTPIIDVVLQAVQDIFRAIPAHVRALMYRRMAYANIPVTGWRRKAMSFASS